MNTEIHFIECPPGEQIHKHIDNCVIHARASKCVVVSIGNGVLIVADEKSTPAEAGRMYDLQLRVREFAILVGRDFNLFDRGR
jgi:hypothetical protein